MKKPLPFAARHLPIRFKHWFLLCFLMGCISGCCPRYANLAEYKTDLRHYHESTYFHEINAEISKAERYLIERTKAPGSGKLAVVLDIDETSLSNWENLANRLDFGFSESEFETWIESEQATAIEPVLQLSQLAWTNHVSVIFITGRQEKLRKATEENLRRAGYDHWEKICMEPDGAKFKSAADFKTEQRRIIQESDHYDIILNVGDQWSDLKGGFADRDIKLPNPFYFLK